MLKEKKELAHSRVLLTITATAEQFNHDFEHELEEVTKDVQVTGFRKGKAPRAKVLQQVGRSRVEAGTLDRLISNQYYQVIREEKLTPVSTPTVEVKEYTPAGEDTAKDAEILTFTAEVDVLPEVTIDGYQKIKIKDSKAEEVTDEDVNKIIEYLQKQKGLLKEVEDGTAIAKGMWTDLGYEGSVDGVKRTDMANDHHPIVVGEGQLIPGFEEELIGMKKGETKTFLITFPKEYHASELAGKKAEFTVTIHEVKEVVLPEVSLDFAEAYGHEKVEDLYAAIRESLVAEKAQEAKQKQEEEVLDQLLKLAKFEVPQILIEQEVERVFADSQKRMSQVPGQWENYLQQSGKTVEALREEIRPQAERNVRVGLALGKLIQEEKIPNSDNAGREAVDKLLEMAKA